MTSTTAAVSSLFASYTHTRARILQCNLWYFVVFLTHVSCNVILSSFVVFLTHASCNVICSLLLCSWHDYPYGFWFGDLFHVTPYCWMLFRHLFSYLGYVIWVGILMLLWRFMLYFFFIVMRTKDDTKLVSIFYILLFEVISNCNGLGVLLILCTS